VDKKALLLQDQFVVIDGLLYRMQLPKHKAYSSVDAAIKQRLCVLRSYRLYILHFVHDPLGHFALERFFAAMYNRFYWQRMYSDLEEYIRTCDLCMKSKPN